MRKVKSILYGTVPDAFMKNIINLLKRIAIIYQNLLLAGIKIFAFLSILLTISGFFGKIHWRLDNTSHFRVQYMAIELAAVLLFIIFRRWKWAAINLIFFIINITQIAPLYIAPAKQFEPRYKADILLINVLSMNDKYKEVINYIKSKDPDVIALEEINDTWIDKLNDYKLFDEYPYYIEKAREDNFGIALLSRFNIKNQTLLDYNYKYPPFIISEIMIGEHWIPLIFLHALPPSKLFFYKNRNDQLDIISKTIYNNNWQETLIIIGDLNMTSWSNVFKRFINRHNLIDSRKGFGIHPTWPYEIGSIRITIDHCLVTKNIKVLEHQVGNYIGSDHLPIFVRIGIK